MKLKKKVKRCLIIGSVLLVAGTGVLVYDISFKPKTIFNKFIKNIKILNIIINKENLN